jgi:uncharacterized membrane protein
MTRQEFLRRLARGLRSLPDSERKAILSDYDRYFVDGAAAGRQESEVATSLGDPSRLAAELRLAHDVNAWRHGSGARSPWRALRNLFALALLEGLLWLPAVAAALSLLLLLAGGLVSMLYGLFTLFVESFDDPTGGVFAALLRGLALLAGGAGLLLIAHAGIYGLAIFFTRRGRQLPSTEVSP